MHFINQRIALAVVCASFAVASPLPKAQSATAGGAGAPTVVGALYFIDNNDAGNNVITSNVNSDGTITLIGKVATGGKGASGVSADSKNGPDALFSQGAVATTGGKHVFAVNPGSNTVTMFNVDPKNPSSITMAGKPTDSGGEFPVSVAFSPQREMACVLNGGAKNGVRCFKVSQAGLTPIPGNDVDLGLKQTTPPSGPANTVSHIIFDAAEKNLLVSVKGTPPAKDNSTQAVKGFLNSHVIGADNSIAKTPARSEPEGGLLPFGMAVVPGTTSVLVTDPGVGVEVFDFKGAAGKPATSSKPTKIDGQMATCWAARSPKTGSFFVTDIAAGTMVEVTVQDGAATVLPDVTRFDASVGPIDLAIASSPKSSLNDFIYINGAKSQTIQMFSAVKKGTVSKVSAFDIKPAAKNLGIELTTAMQGMATIMI